MLDAGGTEGAFETSEAPSARDGRVMARRQSDFLVRTVVPQMLRVVFYRLLGAEQLRHPERTLSRLPSGEHCRHRRAAADSARRGHCIDRGRKGPVYDQGVRRRTEKAALTL